MNIQEYVQKIKILAIFAWRRIDRRDIYAVFGLIFASAASFYLGKASEIVEERKPVQIEYTSDFEREEATTSPREVYSKRIYTSEPLKVATTTKNPGKMLYVGSKSGTKYHLPTCIGAKKIAENNKIWFESAEKARAAGYSPAGNCPGL